MEATPPPAAPPPAAPPPAAPQPAALEDDVRDGGDAIDTFSSYIPASLPECVVKLLHKQRSSRRNDDDDDTTNLTINGEDSSNGVIEIFDTDDDTTRPFHENDNVDSADSTTTNNDIVPHNLPLFNEDFPSHTSPAVESALLSSVSPPCPSNASADIILPLVATKKLSPLQAEGAALAIAKFHRVYNSSSSTAAVAAASHHQQQQQQQQQQRAGFFM